MTKLEQQFETSGLLSISIIIGSIIIAGSIICVGGGFSFKSSTPAAVVQAQTGTPAPTNGSIVVHDRSDAPVLGQVNAKVILYEFSDFQCPFCTSFYKQTYPQIKSQYIDTGKIKIVYRHFPLPFHQNAEKAAEAAECANRQGKFESYYNLLFTNSQSDGTGIAVTDLKKYADQLGLNAYNKFNTCLDGGQTASIVAGDIKDGTAAGVTGTPSFVLNGKLIVGAQPFSLFQQALDEALKK